MGTGTGMGMGMGGIRMGEVVRYATPPSLGPSPQSTEPESLIFQQLDYYVLGRFPEGRLLNCHMRPFPPEGGEELRSAPARPYISVFVRPGVPELSWSPLPSQGRRDERARLQPDPIFLCVLGRPMFLVVLGILRPYIVGVVWVNLEFCVLGPWRAQGRVPLGPRPAPCVLRETWLAGRCR